MGRHRTLTKPWEIELNGKSYRLLKDGTLYERKPSGTLRRVKDLPTLLRVQAHIDKENESSEQP